ncbi:hypothetical protein [Actibacterium mucosum]|uniref:hypothetical protein n=1 Tax=Actibacterium mucosum TaxID=1087332 RepID=UPI001267C847|nr:hypothetical protein [Actibacterium mucosum]
MINRKNHPLRVAHNLDRLEQALIGCTDVSVEEFRARVNNVLGFGDVYWEYGPDFEGKKMAFSVSLENGDEVIASLSRKFGFPTSSKETNFRIGIPPRRWEGDFILIGETGERI